MEEEALFPLRFADNVEQTVTRDARKSTNNFISCFFLGIYTVAEKII